LASFALALGELFRSHLAFRHIIAYSFLAPGRS
jgi:hypothetical protein